MTLKKDAVRVIEDGRGVILFPFGTQGVMRTVKGGNLRHFHVATIKPGAVRGNHRHPHHDEYLLFVGKGGRVVLGGNGGTKSIKVDNAMVRVPKNVAHAVINPGRKEISVICFYGGPAKRKPGMVKEEIA